MYLEISSRQSGKTSRMFKFIQKKILAAEKRSQTLSVCIVVLNQRLIDCVRQHISNLLGLSAVKFYYTTYQAFEKYHQGRVFDIICFDEFDFALKREQKACFGFKNGYYCTSPKFIRTEQYLQDYKKGKKTGAFDLLIELVRSKRSKYFRYVNSRLCSRKHRDIVGFKNINTEIYGIWNIDRARNDSGFRVVYF